jgi:hypothetical protein
MHNASKPFLVNGCARRQGALKALARPSREAGEMQTW